MRTGAIRQSRCSFDGCPVHDTALVVRSSTPPVHPNMLDGLRTCCLYCLTGVAGEDAAHDLVEFTNVPKARFDHRQKPLAVLE